MPALPSSVYHCSPILTFFLLAHCSPILAFSLPASLSLLTHSCLLCLPCLSITLFTYPCAKLYVCKHSGTSHLQKLSVLKICKWQGIAWDLPVTEPVIPVCPVRAPGKFHWGVGWSKLWRGFMNHCYNYWMYGGGNIGGLGSLLGGSSPLWHRLCTCLSHQWMRNPARKPIICQQVCVAEGNWAHFACHVRKF